MIKQIGSYTEISPSGQGLHTFIKGKLPGGGIREGKMEIYDTARFFTVTGDKLPGTPRDIKDGDEIAVPRNLIEYTKKEKQVERKDKETEKKEKVDVLHTDHFPMIPQVCIKHGGLKGSPVATRRFIYVWKKGPEQGYVNQVFKNVFFWFSIRPNIIKIDFNLS